MRDRNGCRRMLLAFPPMADDGSPARGVRRFSGICHAPRTTYQVVCDRQRPVCFARRIHRQRPVVAVPGPGGSGAGQWVNESAWPNGSLADLVPLPCGRGGGVLGDPEVSFRVHDEGVAVVAHVAGTQLFVQAKPFRNVRPLPDGGRGLFGHGVPQLAVAADRRDLLAGRYRVDASAVFGQRNGRRGS